MTSNITNERENMSNEKFKVDLNTGIKIPLTDGGDEYLGDLRISWTKCIKAAGGDELYAELIYEAATNDGLPGYRVPLELLDLDLKLPLD
jgi:hypothetical protein